jgi:hypothetical protein
MFIRKYIEGQKISARTWYTKDTQSESPGPTLLLLCEKQEYTYIGITGASSTEACIVGHKFLAIYD